MGSPKPWCAKGPTLAMASEKWGYVGRSSNFMYKQGQARGGGALGWLIVEGTVYEESWVLQNRGAQKGLPWPWGVKSGVTLGGH